MKLKEFFLSAKELFIKYRLAYLFLFLISFFLFFWLQDTRTFADPDSFYHTKIAILIKDQGIINDFPWLQFTTLKDYYIDHHLLYHLALIPFIIFLEPLIGVKLAAIVFAALLLMAIYWFLRRFRVKGALFYCLLLLVVNPFIFRINLAKAPVLSILFLVVALYFLFKSRVWPLFILSFFYVWLYAGWPLMLVLTVIFITVSATAGLWRELNKPIPIKVEENKVGLIEAGSKKEEKIGIKIFLILFFKKLFFGKNFKLFFACLNGLLAGLVINPYFPKNLYFYWQQTIKIGLINYQKIIGVGAEWYPYKFPDLISNASLVFMLLLIALILFIVSYKKQNIYSWTLFFISLFFFLFTLKSRRNVEYFIPFAVIFSALAISNFLEGLDIGQELSKLKGLFLKKKLLFIPLAVYFILMIGFISLRDVRAARKDFEDGFAFGRREAVSRWLQKNTPQGSIVFQNHWDEFPLLFYYNSHNYYIVGLDTTFMYEYDKGLYWEWYNIVTGKDKENLYRKVKSDFHASYVLWIKERTTAEDNFSKDSGLELLYEDEEARVYQVL